jgi:hypothetical protein
MSKRSRGFENPLPRTKVRGWHNSGFFRKQSGRRSRDDQLAGSFDPARTPDLGRFDQKLYLRFDPIVDQDGGARAVGFEIRLVQISSFSVSPHRSFGDELTPIRFALRIRQTGRERGGIRRYSVPKRIQDTLRFSLLPALRVALAMKAGDHDDAGFLHKKEQTIRKPTHASPPPPVIYQGKA